MVNRVGAVRREPHQQEPLLDGLQADYADSFAIAGLDSDDRWPEQWFRDGLEGAPRWVRTLIVVAHRKVLRFDLARPGTDGHVLGWRIEVSEPTVVQLAAESPLVRGTMIGRRLSGNVAVLSTYLFFARPTAMNVLWTVIGPIHRQVAPYLLTRAQRVSGGVS